MCNPCGPVYQSCGLIRPALPRLAPGPDSRKVERGECLRGSLSGRMRQVSLTSSGLVPRLAALYVALFILPGIQMPFFPVWLKAKDVDAALILAGLGSVVGYTLVGLSAGAIAILITYTLTSLASTPLMPLAETYALKGLTARGRAYGPVRLWGSFAFIAGNFAAGFAADAIPAGDLIWLMVAASGLVALAAWALPPLATAVPEPNRSEASAQSPLRDPAVIAVLAADRLIQASRAVFYGCSAVQGREP